MDSNEEKTYNIQAMASKEGKPIGATEKMKSLAWKALGWTVVAVGALAVINWIASNNFIL